MVKEHIWQVYKINVNFFKKEKKRKEEALWQDFQILFLIQKAVRKFTF